MLQVSLWWRRLQALTDEKDSNGGKGKKVEIKEEEAFEEERTPFFFTGAPSHYQQSRQTKKLNHTSVVGQAFHFWQKASSFADSIDNFDYDDSAKKSMTLPA